MWTGPTHRPPPLVVTCGGQPPDLPPGGAPGYVAQPARMDEENLPVIYRMHTPEPEPKSRLERREVAWREGAASVVTDEHRAFVAKMALNAQETRQLNRELEVGRKRMDSGRAVKDIIDQQQGVGDALAQIATPNLVLKRSHVIFQMFLKRHLPI